MKKFVGFYYRCSFKVCLWAFLSLIGFMFLSSSAFALQSGDFTYTVSGGTVTITEYTGAGGDVVIPDAIDGMPVVGIGVCVLIIIEGSIIMGRFKIAPV